MLFFNGEIYQEEIISCIVFMRIQVVKYKLILLIW